MREKEKVSFSFLTGLRNVETLIIKQTCSISSSSSFLLLCSVSFSSSFLYIGISLTFSLLQIHSLPYSEPSLPLSLSLSLWGLFGIKKVSDFLLRIVLLLILAAGIWIMWQNHHPRKSSSSSSSSSSSCLRDSIVALEADIQHANSLAASLPGGYGGDHIQMKLSYSPFAPLFLYLIQWLDFTCTDSLPTSLGLFHVLVYKVYGDGMPSLSYKERRASLKDFYGVIYPSLRQLEGEFKGHDGGKDHAKRNKGTQVVVSRKSPKKGNEKEEEEEEKNMRNDDVDECGICMEMSMIMVLPNCGHSLCITCFHDWNVRSESCPFCRGSLKRVRARDLWVVIDNNEVVDRHTLAEDNLRRFYLFIQSLPLLTHHDAHLFLFNYML